MYALKQRVISEGRERQRLRRLCRWVLDAHAATAPWGLRLPGLEIPPQRGPRHLHSSLAALAEFPG